MRRNESSMDAQYFENSWPVVCLGGLFGREAVARCIRFHGGQDIWATRPTGSATGSTAAPGKAIEVKQGLASLAPKRSLAAIFLATTLLGICSMQLKKLI